MDEMMRWMEPNCTGGMLANNDGQSQDWEEDRGSRSVQRVGRGELGWTRGGDGQKRFLALGSQEAEIDLRYRIGAPLTEKDSS